MWSNRLHVNNNNTEATNSSSRSLPRRSNSTPVMHINLTCAQASFLNSTPSSSSTVPSVSPSRSDTCYKPTHVTTNYPLLAYHTYLAIVQSQDPARNTFCQQLSYRNNRPPNSWSSSFKGRGHEITSSSDRNTRVFQTRQNSTSNQKN